MKMRILFFIVMAFATAARADSTSDAKAALASSSNFVCPGGYNGQSDQSTGNYEKNNDPGTCPQGVTYIQCLRSSTYQTTPTTR